MKENIKQIKFSSSIGFFRKKMLKKYNLHDYINPYEPAVFMGLYSLQDYINLQNHQSKAIILWRGTDAMLASDMVKKYNINLKKSGYYHISIGNFISEDLDRMGINYKNIPITSSDIKNFSPCKKGNNVYMYSSKNRSNFYGEHLLEEIKSRTNLNIILAYHNSYSYEDLIKIYKSCFIGLRLTKHDGLPNTVIELGLMGRKCIYNGGLPNSIKWNNMDDICQILIDEYNRREYNDAKKIHDEMKTHINIGDEWLNLKYYQ